jgi:hypothetical protein
MKSFLGKCYMKFKTVDFGSNFMEEILLVIGEEKALKIKFKIKKNSSIPNKAFKTEFLSLKKN